MGRRTLGAHPRTAWRPRRAGDGPAASDRCSYGVHTTVRRPGPKPRRAVSRRRTPNHRRTPAPGLRITSSVRLMRAGHGPAILGTSAGGVDGPVRGRAPARERPGASDLPHGVPGGHAAQALRMDGGPACRTRPVPLMRTGDRALGRVHPRGDRPPRGPPAPRRGRHLGDALRCVERRRPHPRRIRPGCGGDHPRVRARLRPCPTRGRPRTRRGGGPVGRWAVDIDECTWPPAASQDVGFVVRCTGPREETSHE